jgi:hypothetical protein
MGVFLLIDRHSTVSEDLPFTFSTGKDRRR